MMYPVLVGLIEGAVPELKAGQTLFINQMPESASFGVMLRDSFEGIEIDHELKGLRRGRFVLTARGFNYQEVRTLIDRVMDVLTLQEMSLTGIYVNYCRPLQEPISYMLSQANQFEFSVNFSINYVIVA